MGAFTSKAQFPFSQTVSNPTGVVLNTGADTMNYTLTSSHTSVTVQPVYTKDSGTVAGTATMYYSVNGTNWLTTGKTLSLTNVATNQTIWEFTTAARYFRIIVTGGTSCRYLCAAKLSATPY